MTIRAPSKKLVETLARSYVEVMLKEMALENQSLAWKATMNYGLAYKKATQELKVLRDKLAVTDLPANQKEQLFERIATLKVSVDKAKAVWNAKQKSYREMWDASIVFQSW